ncbi:MAG TPA: stage II sporulation protein M [Solirubrobacteraceae bacterium]|nr:stage II sporulation protein M [Solirubrobacteraceae bacterium]
MNDLVLVQGIKDTRTTLADWNRRPGAVVGAWTGGASLIAAALLAAVWVVATLVTPDPTPVLLPGLQHAGTLGDVAHVLMRNSLVLALHGFACVAGFIAGSSLPLTAEQHTGTWRWIHEKAGPLAIGFVVCATAFSLVTQAWVLGGAASTLSGQLGISPTLLVFGILPHAVPELIALFLPLAAWMIASRRGEWEQLLAATFVTVAIATPVLVIASFVEVYVTPHVLRALAG